MVKGGLMDTYKQQIKGVEGQGAGAIPKKIATPPLLILYAMTSDSASVYKRQRVRT